MKLYYYPGACSLAPHIALREAGLAFEIDRVDLAKKRTQDGADFNAVNPKGYVPALKLDDGQVLTEDLLLLLYIADQRPGAGLAPQSGMERYRLIETLAYISTEIHKTFGPLWKGNASAETRQGVIDYLGRRLALFEQRLGAKPFVMGDAFTVADAYLFTVMGWCAFHKIDTAGWPNIQALLGRVGARPAVQAAMKAEGLIK